MQATVHFSIVKSFGVYPQPQRYVEITLVLFGLKGLKGLWRTKKFYDSKGALSFDATALGKCYRYANKLLSGGWINAEEYDTIWDRIQEIESGTWYGRLVKRSFLTSEAIQSQFVNAVGFSSFNVQVEEDIRSSFNGYGSAG